MCRLQRIRLEVIFYNEMCYMNLRFTLLYKDGHLTRAFQKEKT